MVDCLDFTDGTVVFSGEGAIVQPTRDPLPSAVGGLCEGTVNNSSKVPLRPEPLCCFPGVPEAHDNILQKLLLTGADLKSRL